MSDATRDSMLLILFVLALACIYVVAKCANDACLIQTPEFSQMFVRHGSPAMVEECQQ